LAAVNLRNGESQDSLLSEQRRMEKKKAIRRIKRRSFKDVE
jgi:hypothetical protein